MALTPIYFRAIKESLLAISAASPTHIWGIDELNNIVSRSGDGTWHQQPGLPGTGVNAISCGTDGTVMAIIPEVIATTPETRFANHKLILPGDLLDLLVVIRAGKVCGFCHVVSGVEAPVQYTRLHDDVLSRVLHYSVHVNTS